MTRTDQISMKVMRTHVMSANGCLALDGVVYFLSLTGGWKSESCAVLS
jgi:hypothetical protein